MYVDYFISCKIGIISLVKYPNYYHSCFLFWVVIIIELVSSSIFWLLSLSLCYFNDIFIVYLYVSVYFVTEYLTK